MTRSPPPVFDGHNDTLLDLLNTRSGDRSFFTASEHGHLDLPRAREGGFGGGFFALFVPSEAGLDLVETSEGYKVPHPPAVRPEYAREVVDELLDLLSTIADDSAGALRVVRTAAELRACLDDGTLAALVHLEGAVHRPRAGGPTSADHQKKLRVPAKDVEREQARLPGGGLLEVSDRPDSPPVDREYDVTAL